MRRAVPAPVLATACLILTAGFSGAALVEVPTDLAGLHAEYAAHRRARSAAPFGSSNALMPVRNGRVVIDVVASGDVGALEADLRALGTQQVSVSGRTVSGRLPLAAIEALSRLPSVQLARPALATTNVGAVTSQGDPAMRSDVARALLGVDGTGLTVGVLSDSFDCLGGAAADVVSGDLPVVNVLQDEPGCSSGSDEGRGMAQLVYDVAPGAGLAFATAFNGQAGFANNILALQGAGAGVIVDDVIYFAEPMFQDGIIAQAVDTVVAAGVPYYSSAGNQARAAYQAGFVNSGTDLGPAGTNQVPFTFIAHDFDPGPGVDLFQTVTFPAGTTNISLQWSDPFFSVSGAPGAQTDLDIAVFNMAGNFLLGSFSRNVGGDPVELLGAVTAGGAQVQIAIGRFAGPDPNLLKYVAFRSTFVINQFPTNSGTIFGHANALGAEAVAAAPFFNTPAFGVSPPLLEPFSSGGTTPILFTTAGAATFDARADKPEITAPDGTNTTFFGSDILQDADAFPNFFGTSAAAPHAAGVAALMLEFNPGLPPAFVNSFLEQTAIDMGPAGFDNDSGWGLIQADAALAVVPVCGDSAVGAPETCDDGNTTAGDGCSDTCQTETGYTCPTPGSPCVPICGDSMVVGSEDCDEGAGNGAPDTCCSATCTFRTGVCRPAVDPCDAAESCSGTEATCPADAGVPATAGCTVNGVSNQPCQGGPGADEISGTPGPDVIRGGPGDDVLRGRDGDDLLCGEDGRDALEGGEHDDTLVGGANDDDLSGARGDDTLLGGEGDDLLNGGVDADQLDGGPGADTLGGGGGPDTLRGDAGEDVLNGGQGDDLLDGGDDDDVLQGAGGADTLIGGAGTDQLNGGTGGSDTCSDVDQAGPFPNCEL